MSRDERTSWTIALVGGQNYEEDSIEEKYTQKKDSNKEINGGEYIQV